MRPTISLGVAPAGDAPSTLRTWFDGADRALYRAKDSGRNRIVASAGTQQTVSATPA